jgi:hypothetical protein
MLAEVLTRRDHLKVEPEMRTTLGQRPDVINMVFDTCLPGNAFTLQIDGLFPG